MSEEPTAQRVVRESNVVPFVYPSHDEAGLGTRLAATFPALAAGNRDRQLSNTAFRLLSALVEESVNGHRGLKLSYSVMGKLIGRTSPDTLRRALRSLEARGYFRELERTADGFRIQIARHGPKWYRELHPPATRKRAPRKARRAANPSAPAATEGIIENSASAITASTRDDIRARIAADHESRKASAQPPRKYDGRDTTP
ncbi:MAG: hypothetical protein IH935_10730, partial [Acidobacteria bacterium]|nr:hypothetical protein [Acidobacteriota bacterium]